MPSIIAALEPAARITVATLFDSLWEAALLALLVGLLLRLLPNVSATTRYAAWCVALVASLLLPIGTALPQIRIEQPQPAPVAAVHQTSTAPSTRSAKQPAAARRESAFARLSTASAPAKSVAAMRLPARFRLALPQYAALVIFGLWCLAALLLIARVAVNLLKLERLKGDALPLPMEYRERLERWSTAEKGERDVRLCTCEGIEVPVAVGLFDSMILIPKHLLETLTQAEIDQIILHELAHLRRADDWTNGLQRLLQALFFFNPAVLYIAQQLDLEREVACDDWVVDQTKEVRPYATCLTKMAEVTAWPHRPLAAPGVFVTRRGLSVRVERLLRAGRNIRTSVAFAPTGAIVAGLIVLFFVLQNVAPTFAFTLTAAAQQQPVHVALAPHPKTSASPHANEIDLPAVHVHVPARTERIPAVDVHVPARTVHIPAVNVDVAARHMVVPSVPPVPKVFFTMPPDFKKKMAAASSAVSEIVGKTVSQTMAQAFGSKGGKFNCIGCDFSGQDLAGHSFRGQRLNGADFSRANLRNADFSGSVLVGVDFSKADLRGANFSRADLTGCDFSRAQIAGINFDGASMTGGDVDARHLPPDQAAHLLRACRTGCDFGHADLHGQDLRNIVLTGVDLSHANLRGANLSGSNLQGVDFSGADLNGARFDGAALTGCDLSGVDMHGVDLSTATITGE